MVNTCPTPNNHDVRIKTRFHRRINCMDNGVAVHIAGAPPLRGSGKRFADVGNSLQRVNFGVRPCVADKFYRCIFGLPQFILIDFDRKNRADKGERTKAYKRYSFH